MAEIAIANRDEKMRTVLRMLKRVHMLVIMAFLAGRMGAAQQPGKAIALSQIPSQYKPYAIAVGQRLQKPGKERITATGSLTYGSSSHQALPVEIVWQYPLTIRLNQSGYVLTFDEIGSRRQIPEVRQLAETVQILLEDSVEGFIAIRKSIGTSRHLGSGYRLTGAAPADSCIDIVQATYPDVFRGGQAISKTYWFDSRTKLLGLVAYSSSSGAPVSVVIDDWREVQGEKLPFLIERWENNELTMRLTLNSATVSAGMDDGSFGGN